MTKHITVKLTVDQANETVEALRHWGEDIEDSVVEAFIKRIRTKLELELAKAKTE